MAVQFANVNVALSSSPYQVFIKLRTAPRKKKVFFFRVSF